MSARRPRVAYFSPVSPAASGIADYSEELLPHLAGLWDLDLFVDGYQPTHPAARSHRVVDCARTDPVPLLGSYDAVLYHLGNSAAHDYIYECLMHWPGLVVLHELSLHHLVSSRTLGGQRRDLYLEEMRLQHGDEGAERARRALWGGAPAPWEADPLRFPLNRRVLGQATGVLAHSHFVADAAKALHPDLWVRHLDHHAHPPPPHLVGRARREAAPGDPVVFVTAGNLTPTKGVIRVLRALRWLRGRLAFRYRLVGDVQMSWDIRQYARELGLGDCVEVCGRVRKAELYRLLLDSDVCLCLRSPTLGETSGVAVRALACGRPLVVSDAGWFAELPDQVALKLPARDLHDRALAEALEGIARDGDRRRRMGEAALAWARERDPASRARGHDGFVREAGLFPRRWIGRAFRTVARGFHELDHEYAACAARLTTARLLELTAWREPGRSARPVSSARWTPAPGARTSPGVREPGPFRRSAPRSAW